MLILSMLHTTNAHAQQTINLYLAGADWYVYDNSSMDFGKVNAHPSCCRSSVATTTSGSAISSLDDAVDIDVVISCIDPYLLLSLLLLITSITVSFALFSSLLSDKEKSFPPRRRRSLSRSYFSLLQLLSSLFPIQSSVLLLPVTRSWRRIATTAAARVSPLSILSLLFSSPPFSSIFLVAETAFSIRSFRRRRRFRVVNLTQPETTSRVFVSHLRPKLPRRPLEKNVGDKEVDASPAVVVPCISLSLSLSRSPWCAEEDDEVNVWW